jgi:IclR family pca regulon transcriptional regulator
MGKLLLANLAEPQRSAILKRIRFERHGPNSIMSSRVLRTALDDIQKQDWALQDEETASGLRSVAAPVRDETGAVVAAINIATATVRVTLKRLVTDLLPSLRRTAATISEAAGFRPSG